MDDDEEERDFSKSIVFDFFTQADGTFQKMKSNLYPCSPYSSSPLFLGISVANFYSTERRKT